MSTKHQFQLCRESDGLIYRFEVHGSNDHGLTFKRQDADVWIMRNPKHGWVAYSEGEITGVPWLVSLEDQVALPPEGDWISRKESKIYVYSMSYTTR